MPVIVRKRGKKFRLVEVGTGRLVRNRSGTPVDGKGHSSRGKAERQRDAININQRSK